jgi:hypothetical protein
VSATARNIKLSAQPKIRFLDYSTKLDGKGFTINDPESLCLRAFQLCQGNYKVCRFGVVCPVDIGFRWGRWTMRMGMEDGDESFPGLSQASQSRDQFRRVHLVFLSARRNVFHTYEAIGHVSPNQQAACFIGKSSLGVLKDFFKNAGSEREVHAPC